LTTERALRRRLGNAGVEAFQAGEFADASAKLERAYRVIQAPSLGLWLARALVQLGKLVEAQERYVAVGRLPTSMAAALIHDQNDLTDAEDPTTLAQIVNANTCGGAKTWAPASMPTQLANHCMIYSTCPSIYPLVHCETANLGHVPQDTDANFAFTQLVGMLKSK